MHGEAFYDFAFADGYSWQESWKEFFFFRHRSRFMHGVFVTILYKLQGFNPPALYLTVYLLKILTSMAIMLTIKDFVSRPWLSSLLTITFTLLPANIPELFLLRKIHHSLAWFTFWLAVLFVQRWIFKQKAGWLIPATLAFTSSILSYEATGGLLMIALFLSLNRISNLRDFGRKAIVVLLISLFGWATFLQLEATKPSAAIYEYYFKGQFDLFAQSAALIEGIFSLLESIWTGGLFALYYTPGSVDQFVSRLLILSALFLLAIGLYTYLRREKDSSSKPRALLYTKMLALTASGAWLAIVTYFPFVLAGQKPDSDSLLGAAIGLIFVALAAYTFLLSLGREKLGAIYIAATCLFWVIIGSLSYPTALAETAKFDTRTTNLMLSLKENIPRVKENTTFVFVNTDFHRGSICQSMLRMLYDRNKLACIHLLDNRSDIESYTRESASFVENTGRMFEYDFVLLSADDEGAVTLIEEISPEGYPDLPITWSSRDPIPFNTSRIIRLPSPPSQYYNYLLETRLPAE